jgi:glycosyltransferase involved in cell wall biosynthesis
MTRRFGGIGVITRAAARPVAEDRRKLMAVSQAIAAAPVPRPRPSVGSRRVVVVGNMLETLVWFRASLLAAMVECGHEVIACVPVPDPASPLVARLQALGVAVEPIFLDRTGINPLADAYTVCSLVVRLRRRRPDLVLAYMIKPVIYGSLAARLAGVPAIAAIVEGLGYAFARDGGRRTPLNAIVKGLYRLVIPLNRRVFFLNPDDLALFERLRLLRDHGQAVLLDGIGVDLDAFAPQPFPQRLTFLLVARFIRDKGLAEYAAAARLVKARHPEVRFCLVGWIDGNPGAIREDELQAWIGDGTIDYLGKLDDVRPAFRDASVYVLPSYYPEGLPRSVMEAMACGRPVITTDTPGCRETVIEGENGFLVPVRDVPALAAAMLRLVERPALIPPMGRASRAIAEARFDVHAINRRILEALDLA